MELYKLFQFDWEPESTGEAAYMAQTIEANRNTKNSWLRAKKQRRQEEVKEKPAPCINRVSLDCSADPYWQALEDKWDIK